MSRPAAATTRDRPSPFLAPFMASALLLFTLGVSLPATLYMTNAQEFSIVLRDLLLVSIPALVLSMGLVAVLVRLVPALRWPRTVSVLLAVAVLVWLQGNILVWQYGALDGREIDWSAQRVHGWIDAIVWVSVLAVALWRPLPVSRAAVFVSSTLLLLQAAALVVAHVRAPTERISGTIKAYSIDASSKFELSADRNVLLIVLDEVQSDIFREIVTQDPTLRQAFDGFTYFPDAVAGAGYTELAIPALLTGRLYDNQVPKEQFLRDAYLKDSVFALLKKSGFRVDIFPWVGWANETILFDRALADNLVERVSTPADDSQRLTEKKVKEIIHLADLSLFRAAPHALKPLVYNNQAWLLMGLISRVVPDDVKAVVSTDNEFETTTFVDQAESGLRVTLMGNAFKYYHLKGGHNPLTVLPDLRVGSEPVPFTREAYVRQVKASLLGLERFFAVLRRLGVYDSAMIVVVADHGSGLTEQMYINSVAGTKAASRPGAPQTTRGFPKDKARGIPLVLVKRIGSKGPMQTSDAAVSGLDLPATIATELGLEPPREGPSMFSAGPGRDRSRMYAAFDFSENKTSYVGPITLYSVRGNSWDDASWRVEDVLSPAGQ